MQQQEDPALHPIAILGEYREEESMKLVVPSTDPVRAHSG